MTDTPTAHPATRLLVVPPLVDAGSWPTDRAFRARRLHTGSIDRQAGS